MNTRYVIPATVAAALHALLAIGFNSPTIRHGADGSLPVVVPRRDVEVQFFDPPEPTDDVSATPRGQPDVKRTPEPLTPPVDPTTFLTEVVSTPPGPITNVDKIPLGPIGTPDGPGDRLVGNPVISYTGLDNSPQTRSRITPVYPFEAKNSGITGEVLVEFVVDETGHVLNPRVVRSTDSVFDSPTLRAVSKWRFEPGRKNGRVVRFRMALPVQYSVND